MADSYLVLCLDAATVAISVGVSFLVGLLLLLAAHVGLNMFCSR